MTEKKLELINLKIAEPNPVIDTAQLVLDLQAENAQFRQQQTNDSSCIEMLEKQVLIYWHII